MSNLSQIWDQSRCLTNKQLLAYLQQTLEREEVYLIESHISNCNICSDALEGLMELPISDIEKQVHGIKEATENSIAETHTKPTTKTVLTAHASKVSGKQSYFQVKKWLVAASILLIVGLGGYSVFSYIYEHSRNLAKNEPSISKTNEVKEVPTSNDATELSKLDLPITDTTTVQHTNPIASSKIITPKTVQESAVSKDENKAEYIEPNSAPENLSPADKPIEEVAKQEPSKPLEEYISNQRGEITPRKTMSKKSSAYGMSNSPNNDKNITTGYKNQTNTYPSQKEAKNVDQELLSTTTVTNKTNESEDMSYYELGMQAYSQGNYKQSITYLEEALEEADKSNREDIEFQLAKAYKKTGKRAKANRLLEKLAKQSKYQKEASEELEQVTK